MCTEERDESLRSGRGSAVLGAGEGERKEAAMVMAMAMAMALAEAVAVVMVIAVAGGRAGRVSLRLRSGRRGEGRAGKSRWLEFGK